MLSCLHKAEVLETDVGAKCARHDHAQQDHNLLPARLALVFQRFLRVVGGPRRVLHRALHVRVDPARSQGGHVVYYRFLIHGKLICILNKLQDVVRGKNPVIYV